MIFVITRPRENWSKCLASKNFLFLPVFRYKNRRSVKFAYNKKTVFILTSQQASKWIIKNNLSKQNIYYCVGKKTAEFLKENNFINVFYPTVSTVKNLITYIIERHVCGQNYIYLSGHIIKTPLDLKLKNAGLSCVRHIIYETKTITHPLKEILALNISYGFLFYSIQSYKIFIENLHQENMMDVCRNSCAIFILPHRTKGFVFNVIHDIKWKNYGVFQDTQSFLENLEKHVI